MAIGNGTACRETEEFFAELIEAELKPAGTAYVIVNEAGTASTRPARPAARSFPSTMPRSAGAD